MGETWRAWLSTSRTPGDGLHEPISAVFLHSLDKGQVHFNVFEADAETDADKSTKLEKIV
jgi:hypothetical protein